MGQRHTWFSTLFVPLLRCCTQFIRSVLGIPLSWSPQCIRCEHVHTRHRSLHGGGLSHGEGENRDGLNRDDRKNRDDRRNRDDLKMMKSGTEVKADSMVVEVAQGTVVVRRMAPVISAVRRMAQGNLVLCKLAQGNLVVRRVAHVSSVARRMAHVSLVVRKLAQGNLVLCTLAL